MLSLLGANVECTAIDCARSNAAGVELRRRARAAKQCTVEERRQALRSAAAHYSGGLGTLSRPAPPEAVRLFLE
ncbi:hypothetical protein ACIA74_43870 [Streptomyces sp. NPDC051658]|uniref:hypothetical protein n=1 Tax=Streptomyces sp. NPDC051658 TaxID=3365667 RepID=UPI00379EBD8F